MIALTTLLLTLLATLSTLTVASNVVDLDEPVFGHHVALQALTKRSDAPGYVSPASIGGGMQFSFEGQPTTKPEPINIIVSGKSSFGTIAGSTDYAIFNASRGFSQYLSALNYSDECLGLHLSTPAYANVSGSSPELLDFLYRENFGDYPEGTCQETLSGGHHFRGWRQTQSAAFFLASSLELNLTLKHTLAPNGYDLGRQEFVARARRGGVDYAGCTWPPAAVVNLTDLVQPDAGGPSGEYNHDIGLDGVVALVTVGSPVCPDGSVPSSPNGTSTSTTPTPHAGTTTTTGTGTGTVGAGASVTTTGSTTGATVPQSPSSSASSVLSLGARGASLMLALASLLTVLL